MVSVAVVIARFAAWASLAAFVLAAACNAYAPPGSPEELCQRSCASRAQRCSDHECARGCAFILDRLVEHETDRVIGCVGAGRGPCDDAVWAECAVKLGVHADGGPPLPPPPQEE